MSDALELELPEEPDRLERISDRLNPILMKEVRQAMRGRYFKISFWITLAVATSIGVGVLLVSIIDGGHEQVLGPIFFASMFACLVLASQVFVPFFAFLSMGGEWEENTWDLLVLSNLRPRQIVIGKVLSSSVQAVLYYCTFGPFLVFAFLLRGIDMTALVVALSVSLFVSLLLSCVSVAMSSFSTGKFARVILMVLLAVILIGVSIGTVAWATQLMFFPGQLHDTEMLLAIGATLSVIVAVAAFFFASTCARLAHPEENRSSGLRITALAIIACGLGWASYIMYGNVDDDAMLICTCLAFACLGVSSLFFATEPERLGRRVAATLPRNRVLAYLATPLLPGGARGMLFFVAGGLLVTAWMYVFPVLADKGFQYRDGQDFIPLVLLAYGVLFLGLPSGLAARGSGRMRYRITTRVAILVFFVAAILIPPLIGFLFRIDSLATFEHPGNVFLVVDHLMRHPMRDLYGMLIVVLLAALAAIVNVRRVLRSGTELNRALRLRAESEA